MARRCKCGNDVYKGDHGYPDRCDVCSGCDCGPFSTVYDRIGCPVHAENVTARERAALRESPMRVWDQ